MAAQDTHKPKGKYTILTTIAEKYTTNPGHPGNTTPVMDEIFNTFLIPQMFARGRPGEVDPRRGRLGLLDEGAEHLPQVEGPGARLAAARSACRGPRHGALALQRRITAFLPAA